MDKIAIYPGTFDPITNGHSDLIRRAAGMFDKVILAIAANPEKQPLFSCDERLHLAEQVLAENDNIEITMFSELLLDFAHKNQSKIILRGLRAVSDFEYEFQLASMNRRLDPNMETVFLAASENHTFVSASLIKEIARYGGDFSQFVHPAVHVALKEKYNLK